MNSLKKFGHLLVEGKAGSGKTTFLCSFVAEKSSRYTPDELGLYVIGRADELKILNRDSHLLCPVVDVSDQKAAQSILSSVETMMEDRYNDDSKEKTKKKIIVVIDGLESVAEGEKENSLLRLLHFSRHAGIYLLMSTQSSERLSEIINHNILNRLTINRNISEEDSNGKY